MSRPPAGRLAALFGVLCLAFTGIGARLVLLQVRDAEAYEALARQQRVRRLELPAPRGTIYDRGGRQLALSLPARAVYANPGLIDRPERVARRLAPLLGARLPELRRLLRQDGSFVYLARAVDLSVARRIDELDLPGIGFLNETKRHYPGEELASQVLGFVGIDGEGLAGLELEYDRMLAGRAGDMVVEQDPNGRLIPYGEQRGTPPTPGRGLVLTIDADVQFRVEEALAEAVETNGARGGMAVVLDPATGDVLAMASNPTFDANRFRDTSNELTRNRPVTDVFEPGSVNKVITAAAALEDAIVRPGEVLWVPDRYQVGNRMFGDDEAHGTIPMTIGDIIGHSSNVGTILLAERLGADRLAAYLDRFGLGRETGIRFPGEEEGIVHPHDQWWQSSMGTIPIGQGIAVTLLQMASVYATVANGGVAVQPRFVLATGDDPSPRATIPVVQQRVVSSRTARLLRSILAYAVSDGTGKQAQIPGYWVAGKTGTARKPMEGTRGYSDEVIASFMGFAPVRTPRIVVAVLLDEPETVYGGVAAAPLFREIMQFTLTHLRVPAGEPVGPPPTAGGR
jgi:cell division protein FtsI (penicillin-binding protein 3)